VSVNRGVQVVVGVAELVGLNDGVCVAVFVAVLPGERVAVGEGELVMVEEGVSVTVFVAVLVRAVVGTGVAERVRVKVAVTLGVLVKVQVFPPAPKQGVETAVGVKVSAWGGGGKVGVTLMGLLQEKDIQKREKSKNKYLGIEKILIGAQNGLIEI
jgi:hypothetical protein